MSGPLIATAHQPLAHDLSSHDAPLPLSEGRSDVDGWDAGRPEEVSTGGGPSSAGPPADEERVSMSPT